LGAQRRLSEHRPPHGAARARSHSVPPSRLRNGEAAARGRESALARARGRDLVTTAIRVREFAPTDYEGWIAGANACYPEYPWSVTEMRHAEDTFDRTRF